MNQPRKSKEQYVLETIRIRIGPCFGDQDKVFGGHPSEEEVAKEVREFAVDHNVGLAELRKIVARYLYHSGVSANHLKEQTERACDFFAREVQ